MEGSYSRGFTVLSSYFQFLVTVNLKVSRPAGDLVKINTLQKTKKSQETQ